MRSCPNCGQSVATNTDRFCPHCGAMLPITGATTSNTIVPPPAAPANGASSRGAANRTPIEGSWSQVQAAPVYTAPPRPGAPYAQPTSGPFVDSGIRGGNLPSQPLPHGTRPQASFGADTLLSTLLAMGQRSPNVRSSGMMMRLVVAAIALLIVLFVIAKIVGAIVSTLFPLLLLAVVLFLGYQYIARGRRGRRLP